MPLLVEPDRSLELRITRSLDLYIGFWDNFQEFMDTFSLLTEVRIASQYLHWFQ